MTGVWITECSVAIRPYSPKWKEQAVAGQMRVTTAYRLVAFAGPTARQFGLTTGSLAGCRLVPALRLGADRPPLDAENLEEVIVEGLGFALFVGRIRIVCRKAGGPRPDLVEV